MRVLIVEDEVPASTGLRSAGGLRESGIWSPILMLTVRDRVARGAAKR